VLILRRVASRVLIGRLSVDEDGNITSLTSSRLLAD
jgi:hypothetical protein